MRRLAAVLFLSFLGAVILAAAEDLPDHRSLIRALGRGPGEAFVRLEVDGTAVYRGQDLVIRMTFENKTPTEFRFEPDAFGPGSFLVSDKKGGHPRMGDAPPAGQTGSGEEDSVLPGFGKLEKLVNLSTWYPRLTSKYATWDVAWSHGGWSAGPLRVVVIRAHDPGQDDTAIVETDLGKMTWDLLPDAAPAHVKHFVDLVRIGFYDGLTIHRVVPGILIEGGDAMGDGSGAWETMLPPEVSRDLRIEFGMVGASRRQTSMTSDTMFFMTLSPAPYMAGKQTFFAKMTSGFQILRGILERADEPKKAIGDPERLARPVTIRRIRIR